jgi:hypothetical protein
MKVCDFKKAKDHKKKLEEAKKKHASSRELNVSEYEKLSGMYGEVVEQYKDLANNYIKSGDFLKKMADRIDQVADMSNKYSYFSLLAEHFIVKNNLEDEFISFINEVAANEANTDYRDAAEFKREDYDIHGFILDEYGFMKEEEMEEVQ